MNLTHLGHVYVCKCCSFVLMNIFPSKIRFSPVKKRFLKWFICFHGQSMAFRGTCVVYFIISGEKQISVRLSFQVKNVWKLSFVNCLQWSHCEGELTIRLTKEIPEKEHLIFCAVKNFSKHFFSGKVWTLLLPKWTKFFSISATEDVICSIMVKRTIVGFELGNLWMR